MGVPPFSWVMMKLKNWSAWKRSAAAWRMTDGSGGGVGEGGVDSRAAGATGCGDKNAS